MVHISLPLSSSHRVAWCQKSRWPCQEHQGPGKSAVFQASRSSVGSRKDSEMGSCMRKGWGGVFSGNPPAQKQGPHSERRERPGAQLALRSRGGRMAFPCRPMLSKPAGPSCFCRSQSLAMGCSGRGPGVGSGDSSPRLEGSCYSQHVR